MNISVKVADSREAGRATQGVRLINIEEGDEIAAIASLADVVDEEENVENGESDANPDVTDGNDEPTDETPGS